jgi:hypothetical protein
MTACPVGSVISFFFSSSLICELVN